MNFKKFLIFDRSIQSLTPLRIHYMMAHSVEAGDFWGAIGENLAKAPCEDISNPLLQFSRRVDCILLHRDRLPIVEEVEKLVAGEGVYLMGQEMYSESGGPKKVEILARVSSHGKAVPPDVFIPTVYATQYKTAFDYMILRKAFQAISERGSSNVSYSINVNPSTLERSGGLAFLRRMISLEREFPNVRPDRIIFEILETEKIVNHIEFDQTLGTLRDQWYRIAIDDFHPVGNHNLISIREMNEVDIVKFDGEYVTSVFSRYAMVWAHDDAVFEFKDNVWEILKTHPHVQFVVEKIENAAMFDFFRNLFSEEGISNVYFQGYHFHRPTKF